MTSLSQPSGAGGEDIDKDEEQLNYINHNYIKEEQHRGVSTS